MNWEDKFINKEIINQASHIEVVNKDSIIVTIATTKIKYERKLKGWRPCVYCYVNNVPLLEIISKENNTELFDRVIEFWDDLYMEEMHYRTYKVKDRRDKACEFMNNLYSKM